MTDDCICHQDCPYKIEDAEEEEEENAVRVMMYRSDMKFDRTDEKGGVQDDTKSRPEASLVQAIRQHDEPTIKSLLDHGTDPHKKDPDISNLSPFEYAVLEHTTRWQTQMKILRLLLDHEKIIPEDEHLHVILQAAIFVGDEDKVRRYLDLGADVNRTDPRIGGLPPLGSAILADYNKNHPKIAEILLRHGALVNPHQNSADHLDTDLGQFQEYQFSRCWSSHLKGLVTRPTCRLIEAGGRARSFDGKLVKLLTYMHPTGGNLIFSDTSNIVKALVLSGTLSRGEIKELYDACKITTTYKSAEGFLRNFLTSGATLMELCRIKLREEIAPPLFVNVLSPDLCLPPDLRKYLVDLTS
ncbi:uncharacterized protein LOC135492116 [Lineus longissimus]|uniref:uncharacterized protein LOC135492116 n=1 Tax=Lineus longissimus TaxID=88925 RepID=UPI00315D21CF